MRFYFMRHGESVANREGWLAGSTDTPLTKKGRAQARQAQHIVNNLPITKIYHSSLLRAHETALLVNETKQAVLCARDDLKEWNMGDWEGGPVQEIPNRISQGLEPANGETKQDLLKRIHKAFQSLLHIEAPFLIVAHGNVFQALSECLSLQTDIQNAQNCIVIEVYNDHGIWHAVETC